MRLCPRGQEWDSLAKVAEKYLRTFKVNPSALERERDQEPENVVGGEGGAIPPDPASAQPHSEVARRDWKTEEMEMLRQGAPTYDRHWVSEYELDDAKCCAKKRFHDSSWRPEAKSCGDVKSCLFCAAATRRAQDIDDGYKDEEAVAALLIRSRAKGWHNPDSSSIFGFIRSLNDALKETPKFQ